VLAEVTTQAKVAALVVTHNRLDQLQTTVTRLLSEPIDHVLVVDNASTDQTAAWLASQSDPRLQVVSCAKNLGGAGGFAHGMDVLSQSYDPDWMVLMDDDARPDPGAVAAFRQQDLSQWDALAAAVYYPDETVCEMNRPIVPRWPVGPFVPAHLGPADYSGAPRAITAASFVGFFVSREAWSHLGMPDPDLFLYMDDGLYTLGLSRAGLRFGFDPSVTFTHDCQTLATRMTGFSPVWKAYFYHRNLAIFYRAAMGWAFWPVVWAYLQPRWLRKAQDQKAEDQQLFRDLLKAAVQDGLRDRRRTPDWIQALIDAPGK